jgi:PST family polysaccharide transporter
MALRTYAYGAAVLSAARIFQLAASFATVPVLTRLLSPSEFGVVALAMAQVAITLFMADAGLSKSLVRTDTKDVGVWSSVFWATIIFTGAMSLILLALAWPSAAFFGEPRLGPIMAALAALPLIAGALSIPSAELQKREKFFTMAAAEFSSAIAGAVIAIWMAFEGFGAWSLVAQNVVLWTVKAIILITATSFRPQFTFTFDRLREHLIFARDTLGFAITFFISRNFDSLVVGKVLGTAALGLYAMAFRIMALPMNILSGSIQAAIYPKFVQLREDHGKLLQIVLMITTAQAAFIFPGMAAVAVASHSVFTLLLSERWSEAALIFALFAPAGAIQAVTMLNGPLLQSIGRTGARFRLTAEFAVLWMIGAPLLALHSLEAVALGYSVLTIAYLPRQLALYLRPIGGTTMQYMTALAGPTLLSIALVIVHASITRVVHVSALEEILLAFLELMVAYGAFVWLNWTRLREGLNIMKGVFAGSGD